jgi:hypothetical protein
MDRYLHTAVVHVVRKAMSIGFTWADGAMVPTSGTTANVPYGALVDGMGGHGSTRGSDSTRMGVGDDESAS